MHVERMMICTFAEPGSYAVFQKRHDRALLLPHMLLQNVDGPQLAAPNPSVELGFSYLTRSHLWRACCCCCPGCSDI